MHLEIEFDVESVTDYLGDVSDRIIERSVNYATNHALSAAYKEAQNDLSDRYGMTKGSSSSARPSIRDHVERKKVKMRGRAFDKKASLKAEIEQLSTIRYVKGSKHPQNQSMIPRAKRKNVNIRVRRGNTTKLRDKFIGKPATRQGGVQIFRRGDYKGRKNVLLKDSLPDVHSVLTRDTVADKLQKASEEAFEKAFAEKLARELKRANK